MGEQDSGHSDSVSTPPIRLSKKKAEFIIRTAAENWMQALQHLKENAEDPSQTLGISYDIDELQAAFERVDKKYKH